MTIDNPLSWIPHIDNLHKKLKSITVFGNVCKTHSEKLFTIQKHCMRILFGDKEAYLDKFKTSCRTRPIETQLLCLETLKILKSKIPCYLFQLHPLSSRNNQNFLVAKRNSSLFITNRIKLWKNCVKVISNTQTIPETKITKFKLDLKKNYSKSSKRFWWKRMVSWA